MEWFFRARNYAKHSILTNSLEVKWLHFGRLEKLNGLVEVTHPVSKTRRQGSNPELSELTIHHMDSQQFWPVYSIFI